MKNAAESARSMTERMAYSSDLRSEARQQRAFADAAEMQERTAKPAELGVRPRYEMRKDGNGWTVYDTANRRPARVAGRLQSSLSRDKAEEMFSQLNEDEAFDPFGSRR